MANVTSINPYSGKELASYKIHNKAELSEILEKASKRFQSWRETSFSERKKLMLAAAAELKKEQTGIRRTYGPRNGETYRTSYCRS